MRLAKCRKRWRNCRRKIISHRAQIHRERIGLIAGAAASIILTALAVIHVYWAAGGTLGKTGAIPTRDDKLIFAPTPFRTIIVAFGLFAMAAFNAARIGWIAMPGISRFVRGGLWMTAAIFLLRAVGDFRYIGFFKRYRGTRFAKHDTLLYSPLCLLLACLIIISANS
jgi:hypothetical protein